MPHITKLKITRKTLDGRDVPLFQIKQVSIHPKYDIAGKTYALTEVTTVEDIKFSLIEGGTSVDHVEPAGTHLLPIMTAEQIQELFIDANDEAMYA